MTKIAKTVLVSISILLTALSFIGLIEWVSVGGDAVFLTGMSCACLGAVFLLLSENNSKKKIKGWDSIDTNTD